jgi:hypothetical protein
VRWIARITAGLDRRREKEMIVRTVDNDAKVSKTQLRDDALGSTASVFVDAKRQRKTIVSKVKREQICPCNLTQEK